MKEVACGPESRGEMITIIWTWFKMGAGKPFLEISQRNVEGTL
jgi:hypothetical protein